MKLKHSYDKILNNCYEYMIIKYILVGRIEVVIIYQMLDFWICKLKILEETMNSVVVYPSKQRRNHFICKRFCGKEESHFGDKKSIL